MKLGLLWMIACWTLVAGAQTSVFTYQGQLSSGGTAATGTYDLRFRLLDSNTNLVAGPVTNSPVAVTNGLFVTTIDFGAAAFNGSARWLEIAVRVAGTSTAYAVLAPNQQFTSTPYAIQSLNASNAMLLSAPLAATNIAGTIPISLLSTNVALLSSNAVFRGTVTASNFLGGGAGLIGVPATSLVGILPDTNLSANVPLLNTNDNFSNSVTAVLFTGSGHGLTNVPGAFFWLTVNGTAQASSNLGFIVTNNVTPVTITLPAAPAAGDTFRVAGVGAAGWILNQNAGQTVLMGNLPDTTGLSWTAQTNSGLHTWSGVSCSADGTKLAAVCQGDVYYSTNSGVTWFAAPYSYYWSAVASSADGSHLVATVGTTAGQTGYIWTSANYGVTWGESSTLAATWISCASSASGSVLAAVGYNGDLSYSVNGGANWSTLTGGTAWTGVACSADGTKIAACSTGSGGGYIWVSTNFSAGFLAQSNAGLHVWSSIACSADGSHLVATVSGTSGAIYQSANGGASWSVQNQNAVNWDGAATSGDGSRLAAIYNSPNDTTPGYIYTSSDSGSTWVQRLGAPNAPWTAVACSGNGSQIVAAAYNGYVYTSGQGSTTPGTGGSLRGGYQSALELQYVGNGVFLPLSHEGTITAH